MRYADILSLMESRRSIRQFSPERLGRDLLRQILETARWAPSNHNRQPWRFVVLDEPLAIQALANQIQQALEVKLRAFSEIPAEYAAELVRHATCFRDAPALVVALHKPPVQFSTGLLAQVRNAELVSGEPLSTAMAVQNLLLAAQALGVGTCVLTAPLLVAEVIGSVVSLPPGHEINCLVALGRPAEIPPAPRRKSLAQITEFWDADKKSNNV